MVEIFVALSYSLRMHRPSVNKQPRVHLKQVHVFISNQFRTSLLSLIQLTSNKTKILTPKTAPSDRQVKILPHMGFTKDPFLYRQQCPKVRQNVDESIWCVCFYSVG